MAVIPHSLCVTARTLCPAARPTFVQGCWRNLPAASGACQVFGALYHVQTMYNIKQAAARAGVSVPVLRAWERRYGIVAPERSPSGYRRFDDESVARVRTMRSMVESGWSPSAAAAAILEGRAPADAMGAGHDRGSPDAGTAAVDVARGLGSPAVELGEALVRAAG